MRPRIDEDNQGDLERASALTRAPIELHRILDK
jgi:hypothetical protein